MPPGQRNMRIAAVDYELPVRVLSNDELAEAIPGFDANKIFEKTGIRERRISAPDEMASDLAFRAAARLLATHAIATDSIDFLIFCTQSPDYAAPTTACLLQRRLSLPTSCAAFDINLGCSGYVYSLSLAYAYITSGLFKQGLLLAADTYTKYRELSDRTTAPIFGDAGSATLVTADDRTGIEAFVLGTDGSGEDRLILRRGALRTGQAGDGQWLEQSKDAAAMYMDGPAIFSFTLQRVPGLVRECLRRAQLTMEQVDLFVFHQANAYMLGALRRSLAIPPEKFVIAMEDTGNTGSPTIPIVLTRLQQSGQLRAGMRLLLAGFGVGYSWGACVVHWLDA